MTTFNRFLSISLLFIFLYCPADGKTELAPLFYRALSISILKDSIVDENKTVKSDTILGKDCEVKDVPDIITELFSKNKNKNKKKNNKPRKEKNLSILILPNVSSNPQNGLLLGLALTGSAYLGNRESTSISLVNATAAYTTKSQFLSFIKSGIYTNNDKFFMEGDWRYYKYLAPTFGLGTNSPDTSFTSHNNFLGITLDEGSGGFPMDYNYVIFHQIVNRMIKDHLYLGIGYHLDAYWNIIDNNLDLDTLPLQVTPHWGYSKRNDFDSSKYNLSGLSVNFMYDSRDNQISPHKGYYVKINYRYNPKFLGSSKSSSELWAEFRTYVSLSRKIPRHLIAFWVFGNFQTSGQMPYYTLFATADDQKARSGRGYIAGRYRGEDMVYAEVEYRFPILQCAQTLGGVVFVNATTASNKLDNVGLFDYVRPSAGVGLRILFNKHTRLSINIDFAIGYKSKGFYFSAGETF
jgi:outer membrane protein assembly factor BamA